MNRKVGLGSCVAAGVFLMAMGAGCGPQKAAAPAARAKEPAVIVDMTPLAAGASASLSQENFVMDWQVLGPFLFKETDFGGDQQQAAADHAFIAGEAGLDGTQALPPGAAWKVLHAAGGEPPGMIDLDAFFDGPDHVAAYAVTWINCPAGASGLKLLVGSDDYLKVWINGQQVHTYKTERRAGEPDQDTIPGITLKKGLNRVVVKCVDVVLGWNFFFRLADASGRPLVFKARG